MVVFSRSLAESLGNLLLLQRWFFFNSALDLKWWHASYPQEDFWKDFSSHGWNRGYITGTTQVVTSALWTDFIFDTISSIDKEWGGHTRVVQSIHKTYYRAHKCLSVHKLCVRMQEMMNILITVTSPGHLATNWMLFEAYPYSSC